MTAAARLGFAVTIGTAWLASLWMPVATQGGGGATAYGGEILLIGWLGIFVHQLSWVANLMLPPSLVALARDRGRSTTSFALAGVLMLSCGINAWFWDSVADDAGVHPLAAYHAGYWCWLAAVFAVAAWLLRSALSNRSAKVARS